MKWIVVHRIKSSIQANIPLLEIPSTIIEKYRGISKDRLLPMDTNQKMNIYLKKIAKICNIDKKLTTHVARHKEMCYRLLISRLHTESFGIGNDLETNLVLRYV